MKETRRLNWFSLGIHNLTTIFRSLRKSLLLRRCWIRCGRRLDGCCGRVVGREDSLQLVERGRGVKQGAIGVVGNCGGGEHLEEGGIGGTAWRLGAGDATDDGKQ